MADDRRRVAADAWESLLRVHAALVPRLDRELRAAAGLPLRWYDVLLELSRAPERRLRMSELGERVVLSRTRVSRIVDELVAAGFVRRAENPQDGRSAFATMTAAGHARLRAAAPHYLRAIEAQFAGELPDGQLQAVATALREVVARIAPS